MKWVISTLAVAAAAMMYALTPASDATGGASRGASSAVAGVAAVKVCRPPMYPGSGYFTSLAVTRTTCAEGVKVAIGYYRCRTKSSPGGTCAVGVLGFKCSEVRMSIPTEIDARVTCRRGHAQVIHTYQQNT